MIDGGEFIAINNTDSPLDLKVKGNMIADIFTMIGLSSSIKDLMKIINEMLDTSFHEVMEDKLVKPVASINSC
jgi:hypothetical protein